MSVKIANLTKLFGSQKALDGISFEARPGEILGFLGPNGAGKSTTMKIITCFIPQNEGKVEVCGFDTEEDSLAVRTQIGYLPEQNPLYKDMYVREYLTFVGKTYGITNLSDRVDQMISMTGLEREQHKKIGTLSKGYRQRVGLAQAMIHDPKVLILDEPTSGLDPNQLEEIRNLIKKIGKEKTVILSTHIMQEVQALCDRVVIIDKGKIVADDKIDALTDMGGSQEIIDLEFAESPTIQQLETIEGVKNVSHLGGKKFRLFTQSKKDLRPAIFQWAADKGLVLLEMKKKESSVEDVFKSLTNK
ncbi:MAG: gliding motility-associated ABC transporter ATP-binding subunit GldA [Saprospiraceae bacterium]|nr:gliding motility-associated ABC transporter ATP-binding subunit GldA [Saprospiraceae bacterium]